MKHCDACRVDVATPAALCPLCGGPLHKTLNAPQVSAYPAFTGKAGYHFAKRLLILLSVIACAVCIAVNLILMPSFWWWTIAVTVVLYTWAVVSHAMRRGGNAGGKVLMQVVCAIALALLVDFETGYRGWSVSYVLPVILCAGIVAVIVLILCNRTSWVVYVLYQMILALFGFVPLVLYFTGVAGNFIFALVPSFLALVSIVGMLLFGDRTIKNEFRRRLRF